MRINKSLITYIPLSGSGSGSVTSVALTAPTGFVVSGSPITSSGTFALTFAAGYALPTTAKQTNWDSAYTFVSAFPFGTTGQLVRFTSLGNLEAFTPAYMDNPMTSLGDMIRGNAVGFPIRLPGNTTTTKKYLSQTGDGTNSDAPIWSAISVGEVSGAVSALTGEVSTTGSGSLSVTLGTTAVTGKLLTGLSVTSGAIASTDSILSAFGKVQGQINGLAGGSTYKGSWNASTNTPTIVSGTGTTGDYYIVSTAGTTTIDGVSSWDIGDWIIFSGTVWQKIDNTDSVISVNGQVGAVVLTTTDITEATNLYYTDTRARSAISLTTTGSSGAATYTSGVLNIPNYTLVGLGGISGGGTNNYISKFTASGTIGDSIIADSGGIATIYGAGQVYTEQAGAGLASMFISNNDTTAAINHQTKICTQQLGSGLARTFIQAASYTTNTSRGELSILTENGANYVANFGTIITGGDNAFSLYSTINVENIRLNTGGNSFLNGGNVGINQNTPTEKLDVVGNIKLSGYITGGSWQGSAITPTYGGTGATTLTGLVVGNGTSTMTAIDGTANQLLRKNGSNTGYEFFTSTFVDTSRTITINGTTQDLSANRTYSVGTVTSVALSVPTGLSVAGTPITTSGTIAISLSAGYSIPTNAKQTEWDSSYTNRITSLTTTGTSGAATLISNTLNVPTYTLTGLGGIGGSGTTNYISKFTASGTIGNSQIIDDGTNVGIGISPSYKLHVQGTGFFNDNVRFPNLKGCIFVQTGGTLLGSISMDNGNAVTIENNGFFGLSVGTDYTKTGSNLGIGHNGFGTSATRTISVLNGTAPSTSPADSFQMYSNDVTAGNAAPHFRTENGAVIKLYQETTGVGNAIFSAGGGNSVLDDSTFDGYTIRQLVKALRNQGILA